MGLIVRDTWPSFSEPSLVTPGRRSDLLELKPHEQKTRIDFYCTQDYLGIQVVDLLELIQGRRELFYIHAVTKKKTRVRRIYNRVIFDELHTAGWPGLLCRYPVGPRRGMDRPSRLVLSHQ